MGEWVCPGQVECPGQVDVDDPGDVLDLENDAEHDDGARPGPEVLDSTSEAPEEGANDLLVVSSDEDMETPWGPVSSDEPVCSALVPLAGAGAGSCHMHHLKRKRDLVAAGYNAGDNAMLTGAMSTGGPGTWPKRCLDKKLMAELFSPPRIVPRFCACGGTGLSLDIRTGWDASLWEDRGKFQKWQVSEVPDVVVGCPPCTMYSRLQHTNKAKIGEEEFARKLAAADVLLDFQMMCFRCQVKRGCGFIFEHPRGASSWKRESVKSIARLPGVILLDIDQCRYGLTDPEGNLLKKPTRLMFNLTSCAMEFSDKHCICPKGSHGQCQGSQNGRSVATHSQTYPPALAEAFARCAWEYANRRSTPIVELT